MKVKHSQIFEKDYITISDVSKLLSIDFYSARAIFQKVAQAEEQAGYIRVEKKIYWRRLFRMLGRKIPHQYREEI